MKRGLLSFLTIAMVTVAQAQEPEDALRLAWQVQSGTARAQAIGGAMGSLGGDITATFVNPAGLGFYRTGDFVFTPTYTFGKTSATYLGRRENTNTNKFAFGTTGIVQGGGNSKPNRTVAFSLAINQTGDFKSDILYRGANNKSSYSQRFLEEIRARGTGDGNVVDADFPYGTSLAFRTYWIDTVGGGTNGSFRFQTRAPIGTGLLQQNTVTTRGGTTELAFGVGAQISDKLLVGGTIGVPILRVEKQSEFVEADATENSNNAFNYAAFSQGFTTTGIGFNLKGGLIYKPVEYWRLGFAFHSPTVYSFTDKNNAEITTDTEGYRGVLTSKLEDFTGAAAEFKYYHITPLKLIGSASYVLREIQDVTKQRGFLTADVEYVFYPMSSYFTSDENGYNDPSTEAYLKSLNQAINNAYKGAFNFRAGGELKFTTVMVRAGVAYYGNPYKDINDEKGNRLNLSAGLGYRNKGFFVDATYVHAITNDVNVAYRLESAPYYNAVLRNTAGRVLLTLGVKI